MRVLLFLGALGSAVLSWPGFGAPAIAQAIPGRISGPAAQQLVKQGALLVDVRTPAEFSVRHLEGAVNIPVDALPTALAQLPKDQVIVVYCASGRRSARATAWLQSQGYDARDLGPIDAW